MFYQFILLGHIPGTNVNLTFTEIIGIVMAVLVWLFMRHRDAAIPSRAIHFVQRQALSFHHQLSLIRSVQLIGRKG